MQQLWGTSRWGEGKAAHPHPTAARLGGGREAQEGTMLSADSCRHLSLKEAAGSPRAVPQPLPQPHTCAWRAALAACSFHAFRVCRASPTSPRKEGTARQVSDAGDQTRGSGNRPQARS